MTLAMPLIALAVGVAPAIDWQAAGRLPAGTEVAELRAPGVRHFTNGDGTLRAEIGGWDGGDIDVPDTLVAVTAGYTEYWIAMGVPLYVSSPGTEMRMWNFAVFWVAVFSQPWAEWNTGSIPDGATIDRVTVRLCGSDMMGFTPVGGVEVHDMTYRPTVLAQSQNGDTAKMLYEDCADGPTYAIGPCPNDFAWNEYRLSPAAARSLQALLPDNWFAIGVKSTGVELPFSWARYVGLDSTWQYRPQLIVDYACAGLGEDEAVPLSGAGLRVSPNPATNGTATIRWSSPMARLPGGQARLFDATGKQVLCQPYSAGRDAAGVTLDLQDIPSGVYIVEIGQGRNQWSTPLTVVNRER